MYLALDYINYLLNLRKMIVTHKNRNKLSNKGKSLTP